MTSSKLLRWGGLAALVGGVLFIVAVFLILTVDLSSYGEAVTTATFTLHATVLLLLGLVGLYVSQLVRVGILGFVGFLVAFIGTAFALGLNWAEVFFAHTLAEVAPELLDEGPSGRFALGFALSFPKFSLGWLLFGVATLRARTYPRIAAILLIVGAVITFVPIPGTGVVLGLAVAWLGFVLFMGRGIAAQPPPRVS